MALCLNKQERIFVCAVRADAVRKCIRRCVKEGSKYGLWSGSKVYLLEPQAKASQFAAKNVKVTGTISGDTIRVATIETIKTEADKKP